MLGNSSNGSNGSNGQIVLWGLYDRKIDSKKEESYLENPT